MRRSKRKTGWGAGASLCPFEGYSKGTLIVTQAEPFAPPDPAATRGTGRVPERVSAPVAAAERSPGGSWVLPAPEGAYAKITAWPSSDAWLDAVMDHLATPDGDELRRRISIRPATLLRIADHDRRSADTAGRGVASAHTTVARAIGMSKITVRRGRQWLIQAGFSVQVATGRYLDREEREQARAAHGGVQLRAASTRALTQPRSRLPPRNEHLPRRGQAFLSSSVVKNSPTRAGARTEAASRPASTKKPPRKPVRAPRRIETVRMAAQLQQRMPWLGQGHHQGVLCAMLDRALDISRYARTVVRDGRPVLLVDDVDVTEQVDRFFQDHGLGLTPLDAQRDPVAYLAWGIRRAIDPTEETRMEH